MADEIEVVSDGEGVVVSGGSSAIERFLLSAGLVDHVQKTDLGRLSDVLQAGADLASTAAGIAEQSAMYLKLTPESAKRLKDVGGLMKTSIDGISHAMLGETGKTSLKWLQVENGPASLLTNPAVLSGIGGLLSQLAQQGEAQELRAMLLRLDEKLGDVRRRQRDEVLARMKSAAAAIEQASIIRARGGDPRTLWDKVSGTNQMILTVQEDALTALGSLAEKVKGKRKTGELKKAMRDIEGEVAIQLAVLGRCFELQDEFGVLELDHVLATAPAALDGHRCGIADAREKRRADVLGKTAGLMAQMDAAGAVANENVLLHAVAARSVIDSLNATASVVDEFHVPLGLASGREALSATPWREALRDPDQRRTAAREAGQKAVVGGGALAATAVAIATVVTKNGRKSGA